MCVSAPMGEAVSAVEAAAPASAWAIAPAPMAAESEVHAGSTAAITCSPAGQMSAAMGGAA
ncbi:hypothetical protein BMAJHU_0149 [Burkholderia mallei JHU]|nr:hypothetical protein BMAJHU_0149 [Burkholderia mallei JHU]